MVIVLITVHADGIATSTLNVTPQKRGKKSWKKIGLRLPDQLAT